MSRGMAIGATVLSQLLGCFFLVSALGKFVGIEEFNVYVYSFGLLPWGVAVTVGWFAVTAELVMGLLLLTNRHRRLTYVGTLVMLMAFTLFLGYAYVAGRSDSCHCMGELLEMDPIGSMVKNAVLTLLVLAAWKWSSSEWRPRWWLVAPEVVLSTAVVVLSGYLGWIRMNFYDLQYSCTLMGCVAVVGVLGTLGFTRRWWVELLLALVPLVAVFVLAVAANLLDLRNGEEQYDKKVMEALVEEELAEYGEGRYAVAFYSVGCGYCRRAHEKLSLMQKRNGLERERIVTVFGGDTTGRLQRFYDNGYAERYETKVVEPMRFLTLTRGQFPLIALMEDGEVKECYSWDNISERGLVEFLKK